MSLVDHHRQPYTLSQIVSGTGVCMGEGNTLSIAIPLQENTKKVRLKVKEREA